MTHEVAHLHRPLGHLEVLSNDAAKVTPCLNVERVIPCEELVHQCPQGPNIDLLIILQALQYLGRKVERGSAKCLPQFSPFQVADVRLSEVTYFGAALT